MKITLLNDLNSSGNIAMFQVTLSTEERLSGGTLVVLDGDGEEICHKLIAELSDDISVGAHMHLFPSGGNTLRFEIRQARGNWLSRFSESKNSAIVEVVQFDNPMEITPLATRISADLRSFEVPRIFFGACDSTHYPYRRSELRPWFDQPDANDTVEAWNNAGRVDAELAHKLKGFVDNGFIVFEDLIDEKLTDQINAEIDEAIAEGYGGYEYGSSKRLEHLHFSKPGIRKLFQHQKLRDLAGLLLEGEALPSQTLTFVFGSQQDAHQDTIHLTPYPAGYMCGIWIALQDIQPGSGELVVYPGSHREPRVYMADAGCPKVTGGDWGTFIETVIPKWGDIASRYNGEVYRPKKGTVLFWHENLLHAGSARRDESLERRAIVIHSFSASAVVYYDSSGLVGTISKPELHLEDH